MVRRAQPPPPPPAPMPMPMPMPTPTPTQTQTQTPSSQTPSPEITSAIRQLCKALEKGIGSTKGKEYSGILKDFYVVGKLFPRLIDPWLDIDGIFTHGLVVDKVLVLGEEEGQEAEIGEEAAIARKIMETRQERAYRAMLGLAPTLNSTIKSLCAMMDNDEEYECSNLSKLFGVITAGVRKGREGDTSKLRRDTIEILNQNGLVSPPLPYNKSTRGFNHLDTGRLLCPIGLMAEYNEELLSKFKDGTVEVTANDFLAFLYDDTHDVEDPYKGLCRGSFLVQALRHMLFGLAINRDDKYATKKPIAIKNNIKKIMPEMIAYAACQARFSLSEVAQWGMQDRLFSLQDFYYNVLELFELPGEKWTKDTMEFWNKIFFSTSGVVLGKRKVPPPPPKDTSDKMRLKRIREERYRQQQLDERDSPANWGNDMTALAGSGEGSAIAVAGSGEGSTALAVTGEGSAAA